MEQQRKTYQEKAHNILDELFKGIDSLEGNIKNATSSLNQEFEKKVEDLKAESQNLKGKFNEMCNANADSWEEIRNGFEQAANSLREAFTKAWEKMNQKG